jgi:hypothetical protein
VQIWLQLVFATKIKTVINHDAIVTDSRQLELSFHGWNRLRYAADGTVTDIQGAHDGTVYTPSDSTDGNGK